MHATRLAPLLSATSSSVSAWIMALHLHRSIDQTHRFPALRARERTALADLDHVVRLELFLRVVRVELLPALHVLSVDRIAEVARDLDDDRLLRAPRIRGVAHHASDEMTALAAFFLLLGSRFGHGD